jgi:hypothetical protein
VKKIIAGLLVGGAMLLTGCDVNNHDQDNVFDYIDPKTGCRYLIYSAPNKGGITPAVKNETEWDCPDAPPGKRN